ncbi:MAG: hypothetical protein IPK26_08425 [Planctomycetes bacterium]|nr:hypothetical protein [Planctomycetota bacterium]
MVLARLPVLFLTAFAVAQEPAAIAPPLEFESDVGQLSGGWTHVARGAGYGVFVAPDVFAVRVVGAQSASIRFAPVAGRAVVPIAESETVGRSHYLRGSDPSQWYRDVPRARRLRYPAVWPGIDLVLHGDGKRLEYDFELQPGVEVGAVALRVEGAALRLADGALDLLTPAGTMRQAAAVAWQATEQGRRLVDVRYELRDASTFGFRLGEHDPTLPVVIDPVIGYATWLGGSSWDYALDIAVDPQGNAYIGGQTASLDFPLAGPIQGNINGVYDAFVAKLSPDGTTLLWSTYLGGSTPVYTQAEAVVALAVDAAQEPVLLGFTDATDFPVVAAAQPANAGGYDAFVCRLNAQGSGFLFSTYLGGAGRDLYGNLGTTSSDGGDVQLDGNSDAIVIGSTLSTNLGVVSPFQATNAGRKDAFLARYARAGTLRSLSYFGGSSDDLAGTLALGPGGMIAIGGVTGGASFPTTPGAYDSTTAGSGFLSVFDPGITMLAASTRFRAVPQAVGFDPQTFDVYAAGITRDTGHPVTWGSMVVFWPGANDNSRNTEGFLARFDQQLTTLRWSTLVGVYDSGDGILDMKIDPLGYPWILLGGSLPGTTPAAGTRVVKIAPDGRAWCNELRAAFGSHSLAGLDILPNGSAWFAGHTSGSSSTAITPTPGVFQPTVRGQADTFVVRVDETMTGLGYLGTAPQLRRGDSQLATVTITAPAPSGGYQVNLQASPPGIVTIPATVTIPAGLSHVSFVVAAPAGVPDTNVILTASSPLGSPINTTFRVWPGPAYALRPIGVTGGELELRSINDAGASVGDGVTGATAGAFRHDDVLGLTPLQNVLSAVAISESGYTTGLNGYEQSYLMQPNGSVSTIATGTTANGVADTGMVVGWTTRYSTLGYARAFVWTQTGGMINLGTMSGGSASTAFGANRRGLVCGESFVNGGASRRAFVWQQATGLIDLGVLPGHAHATAYAINEYDQICGVSSNTGFSAMRGFRRDGGTLVDLGTLAGDGISSARAINDHGQTVGTSGVRSGVGPKAFVHTPLHGMRELRDLIDPSERVKWELREAVSINDRGQILVQGYIAGQSSTASLRLDPTTAVPYGNGCPTGAGRTPVLAGEGRAAAGELFGLVLADGVPSGFAALFLGFQAASLPVLPGCNLLVGGAASAAFMLDATGRARLPFNLPPTLQQGSLFTQAFVLDPTAPSGVAAASNGVELRIL